MLQQVITKAKNTNDGGPPLPQLNVIRSPPRSPGKKPSSNELIPFNPHPAQKVVLVHYKRFAKGVVSAWLENERKASKNIQPYLFPIEKGLRYNKGELQDEYGIHAICSRQHPTVPEDSAIVANPNSISKPNSKSHGQGDSTEQVKVAWKCFVHIYLNEEENTSANNKEWVARLVEIFQKLDNEGLPEANINPNGWPVSFKIGTDFTSSEEEPVSRAVINNDVMTIMDTTYGNVSREEQAKWFADDYFGTTWEGRYDFIRTFDEQHHG